MKRTLLALSVAALATSAGAQAPAAGKWNYAEVADPITDARRASAVLMSPSGTLSVACEDNGPGSIYLAATPSRPYVGPRPGGRPIAIRLDGGSVLNDPWDYGRGTILKVSRQSLERSKAAADAVLARAGVTSSTPELDRGATADELSVRFATARQIAIRVIEYQGGHVDLVLTSDGDATAVRRVYEACGDRWPGG